MEYAAGGELFEKITTAGRFSEDEVCFGSIFILSPTYFLTPNHV
jgi:serine/threonine-protein kinase SRK2